MSVSESFLDGLSITSISIPDAISFPSDHGEPTAANDKVTACILTMFVSDTNRKWLAPETYFLDPKKRVKVWVAQFEECPTTERLHVQAYCEFKHGGRFRFGQLRGIIENATGKPGNVSVAKNKSKKQRQGGVNYCLKPYGRMIHTDPLIWQHNCPKVQYTQPPSKKKSVRVQERDEIIDYIESKPTYFTWDQILHESDFSKRLLATCSWGAKYHNGRTASAQRRAIQNVIILYGAGGTGKTTFAQNYDTIDGETSIQRYYRRNPDDGKFWGGGATAYKGQRIIHLEEFCGQETAANFKEMCDVGKEGPNINIKNGGSFLNHETILISSNHHPAGWYKNLFENDPKQWKPIARRFTQVLFFPEHREDGEMNSPDEEHAPYFIDQTEEFRSMVDSYESAKEHACSVWPLPERAEPFLPERLV